MRIVHTISISQKQAEPFRRVGIELPNTQGGGLVNIVTFEIAEDDPRWKHVAPLIKELRAVDIPNTKFTDIEMTRARFLAMLPSWHHGYPQPEDDFGYLKVTYDLSGYCRACGTGAKQIAPFRMKKSPSWGKRSILQLNWVFDEYFVKPDVWHTVFEPVGVGCRPVLDKTGATIQSVVQLEIPHVTELHMGNLRYEDCPTCGTRRYHPRITGFFPTPATTDTDLFKSRQYFGSGATAHREILVSNALYSKIKSAGLQGAEFQACAGPHT